MTEPIVELQKIAMALQALLLGRAELELFQDPTTGAALLKLERESQFAPRVILKTSNINQYPITLISLLPGDPEAVTCATPLELDEALANFVSSAGMHELLREIMGEA